MTASLPRSIEGIPDEFFADLIREEFALAIALPGSWATPLTEVNRKTERRMPIPEAVARGCAFTVELAPHVIGIDFDDPTKAAALAVLQEAVGRYGITAVLMASGGPGHLHLFAAVANGRVRAELQERARDLGLRVANSLRPPFTPHRHGLPVSLLSPDSVTAALKALRPPPRRDLPPTLYRLLRDGDTERRYRKSDGTTDRSRMLAALVTAYINRGWSLDEAAGPLLNRRHKGGAKLHEIARGGGRPAAFSYLRKLWPHQLRFVRREAPRTDLPAAADEHLMTIMAAAALTLPWTTRGHSMWAVLSALLAIAAEAGSASEFGASLRQIAERGGLSLRTTRLILHGTRGQLLLLGWVVRLKPGIGTHGSTWRLLLPTAAATAFPSNPGCLAPPGGVLGLLGTAVTADHDALRWRVSGKSGLGKGAHRLLVAWLLFGPSFIAELVERLSVKPRALARLIRRLREAGVLPNGISIGSITDIRQRLDATAWRQGTGGAATRQHKCHQHEREDYLEGYARRAHRYLERQRRQKKGQRLPPSGGSGRKVNR